MEILDNFFNHLQDPKLGPKFWPKYKFNSVHLARPNSLKPHSTKLKNQLKYTNNPTR
ncbi:hypothetical protein EJD97_015099 [Solanum chilense]|uniref:Uncharacterized protein n=1 Tax=Solanum chilense TaxID=4083 RepID=A0A6N2BA11_SOLCI|nr:hypothetical protein EJD97_015099 [Solanum chilense]